MTDNEAQKLAKKMWGLKGFATTNKTDDYGLIYVVGEINGPVKTPYGFGKSWIEAFKNAKLNLN